MTLLALRIVNNVSYVTTISHESVFFVAGAVFGEVGLGALLFRTL